MVSSDANGNDDTIDGEQNWKVFESNRGLDQDVRHSDVVICRHGIPN